MIITNTEKYPYKKFIYVNNTIFTQKKFADVSLLMKRVKLVCMLLHQENALEIIRIFCVLTAYKQRIMIRGLFANVWLSRITFRGLYAVYTQNIRIINYTRIVRCLYVEYTRNIRIIPYMHIFTYHDSRIIRCLHAGYTYNLLYAYYTLFIHGIYV